LISEQITFWLIILAYQSVAVDFLLGGRLFREGAAAIQELISRIK